ncbi:hypothetical protein MJ577_11390 [Escherichia coli]|nr:hypothetical protein MJ577_11390 [Escherichia coli]
MDEHGFILGAASLAIAGLGVHGDIMGACICPTPSSPARHFRRRFNGRRQPLQTE